MTRIDFYILPEAAASSPLAAAAKLCEKAAQSGKLVYALCHDEAQLSTFDDLLWTMRQGSFISHERFTTQAPVAPLPQVLISTTEPPQDWQDVLINLSQTVPPTFSRFDRVCEIVGGDEAARAACRTRFKFYRDRGYELKTFEQNAEGAWNLRA